MSTDIGLEGSRGIRLVRSGQAPGYRTRILVVDRDPSAIAVVRSILRAQDWEVISAKTAAEALEKARIEGPDAVLMEFSLPDMTGADLCRALRQRAETSDTPVIMLSANSGVAERVASLRAGASDYLVKPPDAQDLVARLKAILDLRKEKAGFVIAVIGSKGGVGASMIAVNTAIALRRETRRGVVLLDAGLISGTVDIMLNLQPSTGVTHLLPRLDELEQADFEAILTSHVSGLQAMLLQSEGAGGVRPDEMRKILLALRRMRDLVVVDAPSLMDENTEAILEIADRVLLVLAPEIGALRGARLFLEQSRQMGLARERVMPILNRYPLRGGLQRRDIENALGMAIQATIPDDIKLVTYSINRGVPLVDSHKRSGVARQIASLAKSLVTLARQT
ncbi:MAG: response regulator [Anaerolineae bacterium]